MEDKLYLDENGLREYDELLKKYVNKNIADAISEYESQDYLTIEEFFPKNDSN